MSLTMIILVLFVLLTATTKTLQTCHNSAPDPFPVRDYSNRINSKFWNDFLIYVDRIDSGNDNRSKNFRKEEYASQIDNKLNRTNNKIQTFLYSDHFRPGGSTITTTSSTVTMALAEAVTPTTTPPQCKCVCGNVFETKEISLADLKMLLARAENAKEQEEMVKEQQEMVLPTIISKHNQQSSTTIVAPTMSPPSPSAAAIESLKHYKKVPNRTSNIASKQKLQQNHPDKIATTIQRRVQTNHHQNSVELNSFPETTTIPSSTQLQLSTPSSSHSVALASIPIWFTKSLSTIKHLTSGIVKVGIPLLLTLVLGNFANVFNVFERSDRLTKEKRLKSKLSKLTKSQKEYLKSLRLSSLKHHSQPHYDSLRFLANSHQIDQKNQ